jgi:hypothetical protein
MTKRKIDFRYVCKSAYKDARSGFYNPTRLLVGEHDLHLGNVTYIGHRRYKYRSTDKIKQINGVTVTTHLLPPFNPFMRALSTKTSQLCTALQILSLQHLH